MKRAIWGALGAMLMMAAAGLCEFGYRPPAPIDRLIKNTTAYINEHPDDAMGPYTLARIHYLAFATYATAFHAVEYELPRVEERFRHISPPLEVDDLGADASKRAKPADAQLHTHLNTAVENYQKAIKMDANNALFHLGLASVSEAAITSGLKLGAIPGATASTVPKDGDFTALWREQAIAGYLRAYELAVKNDVMLGSQPITGIGSLVSYEAGQHYAALVGARGPRGEEEAKLKSVQASLAKIRSLPMDGITPIVFNLDVAVPLEDLLDPKRIIPFNLDGTGRPQRYKWLRPDTGILVWDPAHEGRIASGRQLFGSVTFNMFWSDGYRALDALDDNRDGVLNGCELIGLAVWFDRNQDGVSQPGEVIPIDEVGIAAISARSDGRVGASLFNSEGLVMKDGRVLPTYDWTTDPIPEKAPVRSLPTS